MAPSLNSADFGGPSLRVALTDNPVDSAKLSRAEQNAIIKLVGELPADYIKRLKPFQLAMTIQRAVGVLRTAAMKTNKSIEKNPSNFRAPVNMMTLGDSSRAIIEHLNSLPKPSEEPAADGCPPTS